MIWLERNWSAAASTIDEVPWMQRLSAKLRLWGHALAGIDDPLGESLGNLEERVHRLECQVEKLRGPPSANAVTAETMSNSVLLQKHENTSCLRAKDLG